MRNKSINSIVKVYNFIISILNSERTVIFSSNLIITYSATAWWLTTWFIAYAICIRDDAFCSEADDYRSYRVGLNDSYFMTRQARSGTFH